MSDRVLRPRSGSSAKALLLTILGEYVLPAGGAAWTQTLVDTLATLDIEEKNARQAVSRLAQQDLIGGTRTGRRVRWQLTATGTELLTTGTARIYGFGDARQRWDGRWLVVLCPAGEEERSVRQALRRRLGFLGFGFLGSGVALTPHVDREGQTVTVLKELGLADGAVVLRAVLGDLTPVHDLVHGAWDLDDLGDRYRAFNRSFDARRIDGARQSFAALTRLVHEWRGFPFIDPELPDELLPAGWPGRRAKALFDDRHARWSPSATTFFAGLEGANA
jgi:phenylacetic acid degradation operon negative regulatory protein